MGLWQERLLLHRRVALALQSAAKGTNEEAEAWRHHAQALEILLLVLGDLNGAESYATLAAPDRFGHWRPACPGRAKAPVPAHRDGVHGPTSATSMASPRSATNHDASSDEETVGRLLLLLLTILLTPLATDDQGSSSRAAADVIYRHSYAKVKLIRVRAISMLDTWMHFVICPDTEVN
jgi:hypothetical protein